MLGWCQAGSLFLPHRWGEGASLAFVGHPSSDGVTTKMPYGTDVLHPPAFAPHLFLSAY